MGQRPLCSKGQSSVSSLCFPFKSQKTQGSRSIALLPRTPWTWPTQLEANTNWFHDVTRRLHDPTRHGKCRLLICTLGSHGDSSLPCTYPETYFGGVEGVYYTRWQLAPIVCGCFVQLSGVSLKIKNRLHSKVWVYAMSYELLRFKSRSFASFPLCDWMLPTQWRKVWSFVAQSSLRRFILCVKTFVNRASSVLPPPLSPFFCFVLLTVIATHSANNKTNHPLRNLSSCILRHFP